MKSGLEITEEMRALQELLDSDDMDFDSQEVQELICSWAQALEEDRVEKADNICALIYEWQARACFRRDEADRLAKRASIDEKNAMRLKEYLYFLLRAWHIKKMETPRYSLSISSTGGKLPLHIDSELLNNPEKLSEQFQNTRVEINREAIRAALESGEEVTGCCLQERGESLRIR